MEHRPSTILVVGATGSIGRFVVAEAARRGHTVRALTRRPQQARFAAPVHTIGGDVTDPSTLAVAVDGIDAVVFTLGSDGQGKTGAERIDYEGVRNVLLALQGRPVRVALMTAIGVTNRDGDYNRSTEAHDWKRRSERLVRASGLPYTIVRPGWFDYNDANQHLLAMLQGDRRQAGNASDGVVARVQIARVLVHSLESDAALGKTFELVAEQGPAQRDLDTVLAPLAADVIDASADASDLDAVQDQPNMPLAEEPSGVLATLQALREQALARGT